MQLSNIKVVLLDIEGTTTCFDFIQNVVYRYVKENLANFLRDHWTDSDILQAIEGLRKQADIDIENGIPGAIRIPPIEHNELRTHFEMLSAVEQYVLHLMEQDCRIPALKQLQSQIMIAGFKDKNIIGHVFDDVEFQMKLWKRDGKLIYIYSAGSVKAQQLLFTYSSHGDLTKLIDGYFDGNVGLKTNPESYKKILKATSIEGPTTLFLTDRPKEAYAAKEAGINVVLVERYGNLPIEDSDKVNLPCISSFMELELV